MRRIISRCAQHLVAARAAAAAAAAALVVVVIRDDLERAGYALLRRLPT